MVEQEVLTCPVNLLGSGCPAGALREDWGQEKCAVEAAIWVKESHMGGGGRE